MKRGTLEHPKTLKLAVELKLPLYAANGVMDAIVQWAGKYAPRGNVGKWPDDVIARGIGWDGDPAELARGLVVSGWIDRDTEHRLVIHDWSQHADDSVNRALARAGELFADGTKPNTARLNGEEKDKAEKALARAQRGARRAPGRRTDCAPPRPVPSDPVPSLPVPSDPIPSGGLRSAESDREPDDGKHPAPTSETWDAYAVAYEARYHEPPVRNAKTNGILAQLLKRLRADEAPAVAAFYVRHPGAYYARAGHPVGLLLQDCEKLRTEWKTGSVVTETAARRNERTAANPFVTLLRENR